jgi:hypothetical protein
MRRYGKIISVFVYLLKIVHGRIILLISMSQYVDYETLHLIKIHTDVVCIFSNCFTVKKFKIKHLSCKLLRDHHVGTHGMGNWKEFRVREMCLADV